MSGTPRTMRGGTPWSGPCPDRGRRRGRLPGAGGSGNRSTRRLDGPSPHHYSLGWMIPEQAVTISAIPSLSLEGALRVPIARDFREMAGLACGDTVDVTLELDLSPRHVHIPVELQVVLQDNPEAAALYEKLPPSLRRAWSTYVAEAKRPETRSRRARRAPEGICARAFPR